MATPQPPAQPTPPSEDRTSAYATYVPHDLPYSADFEDSLMDLLLDPPSPPPDPGIRVLAADSTEPAVTGASIRLPDLSTQSLPTIGEAQLPLPLTSALRTFASPLPGLRLTHPGGYFEGGPGLQADIDTFPDDFVAAHAQGRRGGASASVDELQRAVKREIEANVLLLRERVGARRGAKETNARIERELRTALDQHSMEQKIHAKMAEEKVRKREVREKRRRGARDSG